MKHTWVAVLALLFAVSNAMLLFKQDSTHIWKMELKSDEPLQVNTTYEKLEIYDSNGTIGPKTFSQIPHVTDLTLSQSTFSSVENGALCTPPKLQKLTLHNIEHFAILTQSLLANCEKLKSFTTGNAQMEPSALKNLINLESIVISGLNVSRFTKAYLEPLTNLKELSLYGCNIEQIDPASICLSSKLHTVKFESNNVATPLVKGVFENCNTVENFDYLFNGPDIQVEDGAFTGFVNLKRARFSYLETLTKGFLLGLSNVEEIFIYRSRIETITADTFEGFNNLKKLVITGTKLKEIDSKAFSQLPNLVELDLSENELTTIDNISNPHVQNLNVYLNKISEVNTEALKQNLPALKVLSIYPNPVTEEDEDKEALSEKLPGIDIE